MAEKTVDFAAVGRVARRVELRDLRLAEMTAKCDPKVKGTLEPVVDHDCLVSGRDGNSLEIACNYRFTVRVAEAQVAEAAMKYLLVYELLGSEPFADADIDQFAFANGTYHSWPFVRELLYGLTARMGYPPYSLPVFRFNPKPAEKKSPAAPPAATSGSGESAQQR